MKENPLKMWFMTQLWRFSQIYQPVSLALLSLTYATTLYNMVDWRFQNPYLGIALIITMILIVVGIIGWVWDRWLKMWKEQGVVTVRRTPYSTVKMTPKEVMYYKCGLITLLRMHGDFAGARYWEQMIEYNLKHDKKLKKDIEDTFTEIGYDGQDMKF